MSSIGDRIKEKRLATGLSQGKLAEILGYKDRSTIAKIENGTNDISQTKIFDFARALNCSPADLLGIHEFTEPDRQALRNAFGSSGVMLIKNEITSADLDFLNKISQLTKENQGKIQELVNLYLASQ